MLIFTDEYQILITLNISHCEVASKIPSNKRKHKSLYNWASFYSKEERISTFPPGAVVEGNLAQDEVFVAPRWSAPQITYLSPCGIDRGLA